jgi:hypothetical protein
MATNAITSFRISSTILSGGTLRRRGRLSPRATRLNAMNYLHNPGFGGGRRLG